MRHPAHPDYRHTLFNSVLLGPLAIFAAAGAQGLQAAGTIAAGNAQRAMDTNQAAQLAQNAGQERAASQRTALTQKRNTDITLSRATALAAAGGGGADDPTVANLEGNIAGQGEYNSLTALFNGEQKARGLDMQAQDKLLEGQSAHNSAVIGAGGQLLKGASTLYSNYGNGGPDTGAPSYDDYSTPSYDMRY